MKIINYTLFFTLFPFIIVFLFFLSCSEDQTTKAILQEAESLVENKPDSAYMILKNADSTLYFNTAQRAEWNLLFTQAMDRAKIRSTNDSIIREAVNFYIKKQNPRQLMLAFYYMGRINRDQGDAPKAQNCYLKARENAILTKDSLYLARINNNIGMLYLYQELPEEAVPYLLETKEYFTQQNDSTNIRLAIRNLGRAYSLLEKPDSTLFYYRKALVYSSPQQRIALLNEIVPLYINQADYDSAYIYLQEIQKLSTHSLLPQSNLVLGQYFAKINQPDSANYYLMKCINTPQIRIRATASFHLYQMARKMKDLKNYTLYQTRYETLRDSIMDNMHTETLLHLKALYNYEKKENELIQTELAHAKEKQKNILLFSIILVFCLFMFFFIYRMRLHRKKWKIQQLRWEQLQKQQQEDYSEQIDRNTIEIDRLKMQLNNQEQNKKELQLYIERLEQRNDDIKCILTSNRILDKEVAASPLYQKFLNPGNKMITEEEIKYFLQLMDRCYPIFRTRIFQLCPDLEEENIRICYLTNAGLPPKSIAIIMKKTDSNLANIRSRLSSKMFGENKNPKIFDQKIKLLS